LGEIVGQVRTVASDTQGRSSQSPEVYETRWLYDSWGRLQEMRYPDGEVLTYGYDSGGLPISATGRRDGVTTSYLTRAVYDRWREPVLMEAGNGTVTRWEYDPAVRLLTRLSSDPPKGRRFQDLRLACDGVGHVTEARNEVPPPRPPDIGGPVSQRFGYDDFYRLVLAEGEFRHAPSKIDRYQADFSYDALHNFTSVSQRCEQVKPSGKAVPDLKMTYAWRYRFEDQRPHLPAHIGDRAFICDADGMVAGWTHDLNGTRRVIVYDEEGRVQSVADNGHTITYKYDAAGARVIKRGPQGETAYVNRWFTVRDRSVATKHIYVGERRIASKMNPPFGSSRPAKGKPEQNFLYYYHYDHARNVFVVTDAGGELFEHLLYFPFGDGWVDESTNIQRTPYRFAASELDEETVLYGFDPRCYDPTIGLWLQPVTMAGQSAAGHRWMWDSRSVNPNALRRQNPVGNADTAGWFADR